MGFATDPVTGDELVTWSELEEVLSPQLEPEIAVETSPEALYLAGVMSELGIEARPDQIERVNFKGGWIWIRVEPGYGLRLSEQRYDLPITHREKFIVALSDYLRSRGLPTLSAKVRAEAGPGFENEDIEEIANVEKPTAPSIKDSAKTFAVEVAYRTAAIQLTKRTRGIIADALTRHLKGKSKASKRQMILDLLDGPAGGPLVALVLSGALPQVATLVGQNSEKVTRLSDELRLHAGVAVATEVIDGLFDILGPAKEALTQAVAGLPDLPSLREVKPACSVIDLNLKAEQVGASS